jgi:predicted ferric reductase
MTVLENPSRAAPPHLRGVPPDPHVLQPPRRHRPYPVASWRDGLTMAAWGSVLVVVCLWLLHGGGQELLGGPSADRLSSLGRVAALVASDLLLLQVLLMARIPWVERAFGQDGLVRRHRIVGFLSFSLMCAHIVLTTTGYAMAEGVGVLAELWTMLATYPGMLIAGAGTVAVVVVVGLSIRAARARLRYESWHLIHLYAYLGVALALPHQLWTGTDFIGTPWARAYWWALYAAALAAVLIWRVGVPIARSLRHRLEVAAVVPEAPGQVSIYLRGRALHRLRARAGQFLVLRFLDGEGWSRGHPFSLSAAPAPTHVRVTVKDLGDGSGALVDGLRPGTRVAVEGPYGHLTADARTRERLLFMASGIGVTPLRALLEELEYRPGAATLIYRARTPEDVLFREELERLAAARGVVLHLLVGPRAREGSFLHERAAAWSDRDALLRLVPDVAERDVYLCGGAGWLDAAIAACAAAGVDPQQIHAERFSW